MCMDLQRYGKKVYGEQFFQQFYQQPIIPPTANQKPLSFRAERGISNKLVSDSK